MEDFVLKHSQQLSLFENAVKSLSFLLYGRFPHAEVAAEFVYSSANLASLYHDLVLSKVYWNDPGSSLSNRYLGYFFQFKTYRKIAIILTIFKVIEVFSEMGVKKLWGQKSRWNIVLLIECVKAFCRLYLMKITQKRMILEKPLPEGQKKDDIMSALPGEKTPKQTFTPDSFWKGNHTNKIYPKMDTVKTTPKTGKQSSTLSFISQRALLSATPSQNLLPILSEKRQIAELLFVIRPVIYVLALMKFGTKSWKPWIFSFLIEFSSHQLVRTELKNLTTIEKQEHTRRSFLFAYYLLRSPLYDSLTKELLTSFTDSWIGTRPIINLASSSLKDYMKLWEEWYFYTSGS